MNGGLDISLCADERYMQKALSWAQKAVEIDEVPVAALIVRNGSVISYAYNMRETKKNALLHAEIAAIDKACKILGGWRLCDCTLYVTLEPCPMCAGAIINSRIKRLCFGAYDEKAGAAGSVINLFDYGFNHKPQVTAGVLSGQCAALLSEYFKTKRR